MKKITLITAFVLALGALVAACGSSDDDSEGPVEVTDAWARTTTPTQTTGAIYMKIDSDEGDVLLRAEVPAGIAGKTEIHESTKDEPMGSGHGDETGHDDHGDHGDHGSMMGMRQVERIEIPGGEAVLLEPGGYHVMLLDLTGPIEEGDSIPLTLTFEKAGEVKIDAPARNG